jgi:hypothetical protein
MYSCDSNDISKVGKNRNKDASQPTRTYMENNGKKAKTFSIAR